MNQINYKVGFIGAGNMSEALISGILENKLFEPQEVVIADVSQSRQEHIVNKYGVKVADNNSLLVKSSSVIILAVKPQQITQVISEIKEVLVLEKAVLVSIAAGITISYLETLLAKPIKIVRIMSNTPAQIKCGATVFSLNKLAGEDERNIIKFIFGAVGIITEVSEELLNAVTALSGSGPAYIFKLCEIMIQAGREMGLPLELSEKLAIQTILGASQMLSSTGQKPEELRKAVTSPGGTTQAALDYLDKNNFKEIFISALKAARNRGEELNYKLGNN